MRPSVSRERAWVIDRADHETPFVSVIVPARNEAPTLAGAILPLLSGDHPLDRLEILVVDGGSQDGTRAEAERIAADFPLAEIGVIDNPEAITPAALNRGIQAARGEVILRMDGHAQPAPDYISSCIRALKSSGAWVVGGRMVGVGDTAFGRSVALAGLHPLGSGGAAFRHSDVRPGAVDTVYLGAWPREVFQILGGFDPSLRRNQDYELCLRIREAGGSVWLDSAIRSTTLTRGSPLALARQYLGYGRGRAATFRLHPKSLKRRQALPAIFIAFLFVALWLWVVAPRFGMEGLRPTLGLALAAYPLIILLATTSLASSPNANWRDALRLPLVFPLMHLPWGLGFWIGLAEGLRSDAKGDVDDD